LLQISFDRAEPIFRSSAIPRLLSGAQIPHNATYFRIRSNLIEAGLLDGEGHHPEAGILNLHDSRLDTVMKPKVRQLALVLENAGPLHLRALARISNMSLQSTHSAVGLLKASGLIESTRTRGRDMLELASAVIVPSDPVDEIPNPEYMSCFVDVIKGLKPKCRAAILLDDFASGKSTPGKAAKMLLLINA